MQLGSKRVIALSAVFLSLQVGNTQAQSIAVPQTMNCAAWPNLRNDIVGKVLVRSFLSGMATQYWLDHEGEIGTPTIDPLAELPNIDAAYAWISDYCLRKPDNQLTVVMAALFAELRMKQLKKRSKE